MNNNIIDVIDVRENKNENEIENVNDNDNDNELKHISELVYRIEHGTETTHTADKIYNDIISLLKTKHPDYSQGLSLDTFCSHLASVMTSIYPRYIDFASPNLCIPEFVSKIEDKLFVVAIDNCIRENSLDDITTKDKQAIARRWANRLNNQLADIWGLPRPGESFSDRFFRVSIENLNRPVLTVQDWLGEPVDFPAGNLSIVAGRPGGCKTTSLITIAGEALRNGRNVCIISLEETDANVILRLINNTFVDASSDKTHTKNINSYIPKYFENRNELYAAEKKNPKFYKPIRQAIEFVCGALNNGRLKIYPTGRGSKDMAFLLWWIEQACSDNGVLIIDYAQKLPTETKEKPALDKALEQLDDLVMSKKLIGIMGCQFNRQSDPYNLSINDLKETGKIEEMAYKIIGLGYVEGEDGHKKYFFNTLKNRGGETDFNNYLFDTRHLACSYVAGATNELGARLILPNVEKEKPAKQNKKEY